MKRLLYLTLLLLSIVPAAVQAKVKYPGGKRYVYRYTLTDKHGTAYSLDRPTRWLSRQSVERRRRQGLPLDSTDLPVSNAYQKQLRQKGTEIVGTSRWNNTVLVSSRDTAALAMLAQLPFVARAELVWTAPDSIEKPWRMNIHDSFNTWDSVRNDTYGAGRPQIEMLRGERLHNIGLKGKGKTIAVLDGGFHNVDRLPWINDVHIEGIRNVVNHGTAHRDPEVMNAEPYIGTDHGTKVLSAMAARLPQILTGSAPEATYWLIRCEDTQTEQPVEEDYWAIAAELADSAGVDIINSSLGYSEYDEGCANHSLNDLDGHSSLISRTASLLARKGIVLCNSAGNSGMGPWKKIGFPADATDILTVGAVNEKQKIAAFSSIGPSQDNRVKPDVVAMGAPAALLSGRGTLVRDMGTSFSTPIVCGLVACLWQAFPNKTARESIEMVRQSADNYQSPNNSYGYGVPNFWKAYMIANTPQRE